MSLKIPAPNPEHNPGSSLPYGESDEATPRQAPSDPLEPKMSVLHTDLFDQHAWRHRHNRMVRMGSEATPYLFAAVSYLDAMMPLPQDSSVANDDPFATDATGREFAALLARLN